MSLAWSADRCVVTLEGNLDRSSAVAVAAQFDQLIRASFDEVVLELSGIEAADHGGAVALVELGAQLRLHGVACRVDGLVPGSTVDPRALLQFVHAGEPVLQRLRRATGAG